MITKITGECAMMGCKKRATDIVHDRGSDKVACYCEYHSDQVVDATCCEYTVVCPNCGCYIPVN